MNPRIRFLAPILAAAACTSSVSTTALAEEPFAGQVPIPPAQAPDELTGHLTLAPRLAWVLPTGSAENGLPQRGYTGAGPGFGLDLSFGLSRYVAVQARFDRATFAEGNRCPASGKCSAQTTAAGIGVEYHLVNGAAFDPWMAAGVSYRWTSFDLSWPGYQPAKLDFSGVDWLHLAVGGDWYAHHMLGFGPYLAFDLGTYGSRPELSVQRPAVAINESSIHSFFTIGLRGVFAPMR